MINCEELNKLFNRYSFHERKQKFFIGTQRSSDIYLNVEYLNDCSDLLYKFFRIERKQINEWIKLNEPILFNSYLTPAAIALVIMYRKLEKTNNIQIYNPKNKPLKFVFFDTETAEILTEEQIEQLKEASLNVDYEKGRKQRKNIRMNGIVMPWLIAYKVDGCKDVVISYYQNDRHADFINRLRLLGQIYCVVLVGHNIQYDIRTMIPIYEKEGINTYSKVRDGDFYLNSYSEGEERNISISYLDTFFFYRKTLEEASGFPKVDVPYGLVNPILDKDKDLIYFFSNITLKDEQFKLSEYVGYARTDVLAVEKLHRDKHAIIEKVQELAGVDNDPNSLTYLSQSGLSEWFVKTMAFAKEGYDVYKTFYRYGIPVREYEIERRSIVGGWAPINKDCVYREVPSGRAIYKFDITSLYPSIAVKGLPAGELYDSQPEWLKPDEVVIWYKLIPIVGTTLRFKDKYNFLSIGFHKMEWFTEKCNGPIYLISDLYKTFKEYYANMEECFSKEQIYYQELFYHHSDAFNYLFPIKQDADNKLAVETDEKARTNLQLLRSTVKLLLNGGLGKLEQKSFHTAKYQTNREEINELVPVSARNLRTSKSGFYIPQVGRSILAKTVTKAVNAGFRVYRCDTDSILLEAPYNPHLVNPKLVEIFGKWWEPNELGGWTLEGVYARQYAFGVAKKYLLEPFDNDPNRNKYIAKGIALSGITGLTDLMTRLALNNRPRYEELKRCLVPFKNALFKGCKNVSAKTHKYNQTIIDKADVKLIDQGPGKDWPIEYIIKLYADDFEAIPFKPHQDAIT